MAQIDDLIKKLLEEKTASANSHLSRFGDKMGVNKVLNNSLFQKLRLAAIASKGGIHTLGAEKIDSMFGAGSYGNALVDTAGVSLGLSTPFKGKEIAKQIEMANVRKRLQSQAGYNNTGKDAMASTAASMANMKSLLNSTSMLAMIAGAGNHGMITPGIMASKMFGGLDALGAASAHGLAGTAGAFGAGTGVTNTIAGINPMMMGMVAAIAATKATSALYKVAIDGGSSLKLGKKELITSGTSPHQLEQDYGNTSALRQQIARMQNTGSLKPGEALMANILAMIEGHTSVLPYIAANALDAESRRNKEGAGNAQNHLEDMFGDTGAIGSNDQLKKGKMGIISKIFTGMEKTTANLSATFDIMGQLSNTLSGQSSTKLFNEANSKDRTPEMLKAEKKFGETFGIPTGMVQAIHTTPAQIMNTSETYEGKVLSILGLHSEISRFSAHELLKIRTTGFGIKNETTNGFLAKLNEEYEEERLHRPDNSMLANIKKSTDEILGYIPGYQVLSGTFKMLNNATDSINEFFQAKANGNVRTRKQWWTDILGDGRTNDALNSEEELRRKVGATELGAQEQMANYLGNAYPDRFELLLSYNLSQMESLKAMAGNVDYSKNEKLSMNKYTGKFQNNKAHQDYESEVAYKIGQEMNLVQDPMGFIQNIFGNDVSKIRNRQIEEGRKNNLFLDSFLRNNEAMGPSSSIDEHNSSTQDEANAEYDQRQADEKTKSDELKKKLRAGNLGVGKVESDIDGVSSADAATDRQRQEEQEERKMSFAEQQVHLLQEIRDHLGANGRDFIAENDRLAKEAKKKDDDGGGIISSLLSGVMGAGLSGGMATAVSMLPRLGMGAIAAAAAIAAGYMVYSSVFGKGSDEAAHQGELDNYSDTQQKKIKDDGYEIATSIHATEKGFSESLDKYGNDTLKEALNVSINNGDMDRAKLIRTKLRVTRHQMMRFNQDEIFQSVVSNGATSIVNLTLSTNRVLQDSDSLDKLFWSDQYTIAHLLDAHLLSDGMTKCLKDLLDVQKSLDSAKDQSTYSKLLEQKSKIVGQISIQANKDIDENNKGVAGPLKQDRVGSYSQTAENLSKLSIQQNLLSSGGVGRVTPNQETIGSIAKKIGNQYQPTTHNMKEAITQGVLYGETGSPQGDFSKVNPKDNGYGMSIGAFQFNEQKGSLRDLLKNAANNGSQEAAIFYKQFNKDGTRFTGNRAEFSKWFEKWGDTPQGRAIQQKTFDEQYYNPTLTRMKNLGITNPRSISQFVDEAHNRGPGGVTEMLKYINKSDYNNPDAVKIGRDKITGKLAAPVGRTDVMNNYMKSFTETQDAAPPIAAAYKYKNINDLDSDGDKNITADEIKSLRTSLTKDAEYNRDHHNDVQAKSTNALLIALNRIEKALHNQKSISTEKAIKLSAIDGNIQEFIKLSPTAQN